MGQDLQDVTTHPGVQAAWQYGLFDAIFNRRSRRFAMGAEIPGGPTAYKSQKEPVPLDEIEEALLVQVGTGVSGMNLADLPYVDDRGRSASGNTMMQFTGRTYASPCGCHGTELIYWNDEGTYLVKFKDVCIPDVRLIRSEEDRARIVDLFRANRIKIADGRTDVPRQHPLYLSFNQWDSNIPGSTMFLPILNTTWQAINVLLLMCGWADGGATVYDDLAGNQPAGCQRWIDEGLLDPNFPATVSSLLGTGGAEIESSFMMHNLQLAIQAMGLGGSIHNAAGGAALLGGVPGIKGLGLRHVEGKDGRMHAVGLDGILEAYCPPYYKNMDAAVDAVIETKFGKDGVYDPSGTVPAPFLDRNEFMEKVPRYSEKLVQCVKDICNYVYDRYGKFPATVDPIMTSGSWVQAHHLDLDFYDRFYQDGAYTETQRQHMDLWHGQGVSPAGRSAAAGARR